MKHWNESNSIKMCKISSKLFLVVSGLLFCAAAVLLFVVGGYTLYHYHHYAKLVDETHVLIPATVFVAVGIFLFLLGIVGCIGAMKEQKCLLGFFFVILLVIFLGLISASILSYVYKDDVKETLEKGFDKALHHYGSENEWTSDLDFIQKTLECCGKDNYEDYLNTTWYKHQNRTVPHPFPNSCCKNNECVYNATFVNGTGVFMDGCLELIHDPIYSHFVIFLAVAAALAVFQLIGMIASCILLCRRRSSMPYVSLRDPSEPYVYMGTRA